MQLQHVLSVEGSSSVSITDTF